MPDMINHPQHYTQASVPLEPIDILRYAPFDLGNCLKYVLRAGHKGNALEDWKKAKKYLDWTDASFRMNPTPYRNFFERYGLLLCKFEAFENFTFNNDYFFFTELEDLIEVHIKTLNSKT